MQADVLSDWQEIDAFVGKLDDGPFCWTSAGGCLGRIQINFIVVTWNAMICGVEMLSGHAIETSVTILTKLRFWGQVIRCI